MQGKRTCGSSGQQPGSLSYGGSLRELFGQPLSRLEEEAMRKVDAEGKGVVDRFGDEVASGFATGYPPGGHGGSGESALPQEILH